MLKYTNQEKTIATFNGSGVTLSAPEDWGSIGDTPTREAVLRWIAEGNMPDPADPLPLPVISVSPWQIRKALNMTNMRASVENYVATLATQDEKDAWGFATEFREDNPLLIAAASSLNADLHALLTLAQSL